MHRIEIIQDPLPSANLGFSSRRALPTFGCAVVASWSGVLNI